MVGLRLGLGVSGIVIASALDWMDVGGVLVGFGVGFSVGGILGDFDGLLVIVAVGTMEGGWVGIIEGNWLGSMDGFPVGTLDGTIDGFSVGTIDGFMVGTIDGFLKGAIDGFPVAAEGLLDIAEIKADSTATRSVAVDGAPVGVLDSISLVGSEVGPRKNGMPVSEGIALTKVT